MSGPPFSPRCRKVGVHFTTENQRWKYIYIGILVENKLICKILPHLGPTWEFQPCLKSCNLESWTTKWHDFKPDYHPTTHQQLSQNCYLKELNTLWLSNRSFDSVCKVFGRCLEGAAAYLGGAAAYLGGAAAYLFLLHNHTTSWSNLQDCKISSKDINSQVGPECGKKDIWQIWFDQAEVKLSRAGWCHQLDYLPLAE